MGKQKSKHDVLGWQVDCIDYKPCPLCYGCRNHDSSYIRCEKCAVNRKLNICNVKLHTESILERMISREVINLDK